MEANTYYLNRYQAKQDRFDELCEANADAIAERAQELYDEDPHALWDDCLHEAENEIVREMRKAK